MTDADGVETTADDQIEEVETEESAADEAQPNPKLLSELVEQRKELRAERAELKKRLAVLEAERADAAKEPAEAALDQARREAASEATEKANARIVRAEIRAAAAQRVKNPALAVKLIDSSAIEVDDDGEVDGDALNSAIDALLTDYPELAASAPGFGSADQGAKGRAAAPSQLTKSDLDTMTPQQINDARRAGRLDKLLGKTT